MRRIHPCISQRLHAISEGVMSLPPEYREAYLRHVTSQLEQVDHARWALRTERARILGELTEAEPLTGTTGV